MIYGILPVGGKGTRLALPFPKELLPQKGFDHYNPLINHIVQKMLIAEADMVYFVHGEETKQGIVDYYSEPRFVHLTQRTPGFATVLRDFYESRDRMSEKDKVLFGMPDTIFEGNPFVEMLNHSGIVCGMFTTDPYTKVDRLSHDSNMFQVKSAKNTTNQNQFWGILKFDGSDINQIIDDRLLDKTTEIGEILNHYPNKKFVMGESYLDLGTWLNYNRYLALYGGCYDEN